MKSCKPSVRVIEQPIHQYRFRYETEKESITRLPGRRTKNSVPSIEISGCIGEVHIIISCVTEHKPYRPHPFGVVDRNGIKVDHFVNTGIYSQRTVLTSYREVVNFNNIGITCTPNGRPLKQMLEHRKRLNIDPFTTGFDGFLSEFKSEGKASTAVRLCFQVIKIDEKKELVPLKPVVSDPIRTKKNLIIDHVSHHQGPAYVPTLITIVCSKIPRNDIEVIFFEEINGEVKWDGTAQVANVYRENTITCYTPLYKGPFASGQVFIKLRRKSDNTCSNSVKFFYTNSNTSHKTLDKSLLPKQEQGDSSRPQLNIRDPDKAVCSTWQLQANPHTSSAFLNQEHDQFQVNNQVQRPQISQGFPQLLEWSNGSSVTSSMHDYIDGIPSTSGMVYPLPDNDYSDVARLSDDYNCQAVTERIADGNTAAGTTIWPLKTNESIEYRPYYHDQDEVLNRGCHQPTLLDDPLPSFETINQACRWPPQSLNVSPGQPLEKQ